MPSGTPYQTEVAASWTDKEDLIDADLIGGNFRRLYTAVNGGMTAQNLDWDNVSIDEKKIQFPEFIRDVQPNVGHTHGHNGVDSSFLSIGSVDRRVTERRSFGAYMFPSNDRPVFTYHGVVPIQVSWPKSTDSTSGRRSVYIDIPYDPVRLPKFWRTDQVTARAFGSLQVLNPALLGYVTVQNLGVVQYGPTNGIFAMYLRATIQFRGSEAPIESTDGMFLHWTLIVQARPEA
jgi:hypothetical protein